MNGLERDLRALGTTIAFPAEGDFATLVVERLRREPEPEPRRWWSRRPRAALALAVAAAAIGAAFAVPESRSAILDFLGIGGVEIKRTETTPTAPRGVVARGDRTSLDEAAAAVEFTLLVPDVEIEAVHLDRSLPGGRVSFVLPGGVVLQEFQGEALGFAQKFVGPGTRVDHLRVNRSDGVWISGEPHVVVFEDRNGRIREERLAGNVLLWERSGLTLRLEGAATKEQALEIARRIR